MLLNRMHVYRLSARVGSWAALLGVVLGLAHGGTLVATPLLGGSASRAPFLALAAAIPTLSAMVLVVLWAAIHACTAEEHKVLSLAGLAWVVLAAAVTVTPYFLRLALLPEQPPMESSANSGSVLPAGWPAVQQALEWLSFAFFGLACLFTAPLFGGSGLQRALRWTLVLSGLLGLAGAAQPLVGQAFLSWAGTAAWGPGLALVCVLLLGLFRRIARQAQEF